jgi:hypothetical protein
MLADIVDEKCTDCTTVIGRSDGAISLLTSSVPNLRLDGLCVNLDRPCRELNTDSGLGVEVKFVPSESAQQVGFTNSRVADENDWVKVSRKALSLRVSGIVPLKRNCDKSQRGCRHALI